MCCAVWLDTPRDILSSSSEFYIPRLQRHFFCVDRRSDIAVYLLKFNSNVQSKPVSARNNDVKLLESNILLLFIYHGKSKCEMITRSVEEINVALVGMWWLNFAAGEVSVAFECAYEMVVVSWDCNLLCGMNYHPRQNTIIIYSQFYRNKICCNGNE